MAVSLSIKNVPDELAAGLRERARINHRSVQGELMAILEAAVTPRPASPTPRAGETPVLREGTLTK